ncbi:hypothetical protein [Allokutzneria oryzae]|uniref:DUF2127 domain-containing protein n=1 Tax=Allokutzneria oryzae TaxID=1378989 RepID=A0ABV5ZWD8_9PSEU
MTTQHENAAPRPRTVEVAFWLSVVSALSAFVSLAYFISLRQDMLDSLTAAVQQLDAVPPERKQDFVENAVNLSITLAVIVVGAVGVLLLVFAFMMRRGRNWARIVLTIVAVLGLGGMTTNVNGVVLSSPGPLALITFFVNVAVIVLLYVPPSNRYFAEHRLRGQA